MFSFARQISQIPCTRPLHLHMTATSLDQTERDILANISGALAVLEHRRGSALIPAACAPRHHAHTGCCAATQLMLPLRAATCARQYVREA